MRGAKVRTSQPLSGPGTYYGELHGAFGPMSGSALSSRIPSGYSRGSHPQVPKHQNLGYRGLRFSDFVQIADIWVLGLLGSVCRIARVSEYCAGILEDPALGSQVLHSTT